MCIFGTLSDFAKLMPPNSHIVVWRFNTKKDCLPDTMERMGDWVLSNFPSNIGTEIVVEVDKDTQDAVAVAVMTVGEET